MLRDTSIGNGALDYQVQHGSAGQIEGVRIHLGAASATAEDLTVSLISAAGSEFNVVLKTQDMNALSDFVWTPARPEPYFPGDIVKVDWANSNTKTYGLEVLRKNAG